MSGSINSFQFVCKTLHFQMLRQLQQQQQPEQQPPLTSRATAMTMPEDVCPCLCPPRATSFLFFNVVVLRLAKDSRELEATYCRTCLFTARKARRTTSSRGTRSTLTRQAGRRTGTRAAAVATGNWILIVGSCLSFSSGDASPPLTPPRLVSHRIASNNSSNFTSKIATFSARLPQIKATLKPPLQL